MFTLDDTLIEEALDQVIQILIYKYDTLGMRATGRWAEGLEGVVVQGNGVVKGYPYTQQLVLGRAPGKLPPIAPLERWVKAKLGLTGKQATRAAFAVATTIAQEGTSWYQRGGSDFLEVLNTQEVLEAFYGHIGKHLRFQIEQELKRQLKEVEP